MQHLLELVPLLVTLEDVLVVHLEAMLVQLVEVVEEHQGVAE